MATASVFIFGSASATEFTTVQELLSQLPDNSAYAIQPRDVRDSIYTLWEQISAVGIIAGSAASASSLFLNPNPTTIETGGINIGTTFSPSQTMQQMWDALLYPYILPGAEITIAGGLVQREYGDPNGLANNSVTLIWNAIQRTSTVNIFQIIVDGVGQVATGASQSSTKLSFATHSWNTSNLSETYNFSMSVEDTNTSTVTASTGITFMNNIYWGRIDLSTIGNPNLTLSPASAPLVASLCTDALIMVLSGAGVLPGYNLSTTKNIVLDGIAGNGQYLIFAWPTQVSGGLVPKFYVNGFLSTAFTRVRTISAFVNQYGFITNYEVWVSNTIQNSPLDIEIK